MVKLFLIVIYKEKLSSCKTFLSFKKCDLFKNKNNKFIIWDNSPSMINTSEECKKESGIDDIAFYHTPENLSLSKIYNYVIKEYYADLYCIFDQDSELTRSDYDNYLNSVVADNPNVNIFLPQIYSGTLLYSPGKFWIFKGSHYKHLEPGVNKNKKYTAITSGMCVRRDVFYNKHVWFNEELQLYGIDTNFFNTYRNIDCNFFVLDMVMNHDLSQDSLTEDLRKERVYNYYKCLLKSENNILYKIFILCYMALCKLLGKI